MLLPARCYQYDAVGPLVTVVTLIAGSKRRCLLMAGEDGEMFMTRSLNVTPKSTEQHLTARSNKSVTYVTNNKRLHSTFCTTEDNYWQTRSIARPLCDSRATCSCGPYGFWLWPIIVLLWPISLWPIWSPELGWVKLKKGVTVLFLGIWIWILDAENGLKFYFQVDYLCQIFQLGPIFSCWPHHQWPKILVWGLYMFREQ